MKRSQLLSEKLFLREKELDIERGRESMIESILSRWKFSEKHLYEYVNIEYRVHPDTLYNSAKCVLEIKMRKKCFKNYFKKFYK